MSSLPVLGETHNRAHPSLRLAGNGEWVPAPRGGGWEARGRPLPAGPGSRKAKCILIIIIINDDDDDENKNTNSKRNNN